MSSLGRWVWCRSVDYSKKTCYASSSNRKYRNLVNPSAGYVPHFGGSRVYATHTTEAGSVIKPRIHPDQAVKLSRKPGPYFYRWLTGPTNIDLVRFFDENFYV